MPLPSDMDTVTVTGRYVNVDGTPAQGTVTFQAVTRLRSSGTATSILPSSVVAALDGTGYLSAQIPATDDPDITPPGWAWQVSEAFGPADAPTYRRSYLMLAPSGQSIDLTNVQPAGPQTPPVANTVVTVAGHGPDAEGDVPIALEYLSDAAVSALSAGQILLWDGTHWVNSAAPHGMGDLVSAANLSDVASVPTARTNLGLRGAALLDVGTSSGTVAAGDDGRITGAMQKAANLADLASIPTARTTLGLGGAALLGVGTTSGTVAAGDDSRIVGAAQKASNLSDLASATTARTNLGLGGAALLNVGTTTGTVTAGDDSRVTGAAQKANNLSDLASASTARTNLGLGGAALLNVGTAASTVAAGNDSRITGALQAANNLSDVATVATARTNLGLGGAATRNVGTTSGTVPDGADTRITITQDASVGNSALGTRVSALETIRDTHGRWYRAATGAYTSNAAVKYDTVETTPNLVSLNSSTGVVTVTNAGQYTITATVLGNISAAGTVTLVIVKGSTPLYSGGCTLVASSAQDFFVEANAVDVTFAAGETFNINLSWSGAGSVTNATALNTVTTHGTNLGIRRTS